MGTEDLKKSIAERTENIKKTVKNFTEEFYSLKVKQKEVLRGFIADFKKKKNP